MVLFFPLHDGDYYLVFENLGLDIFFLIFKSNHNKESSAAKVVFLEKNF